MAKASRLTLAFIKKRPRAAARVLASLPVEEAAVFVDSIPSRYAIMVLEPLHTNLTAGIVQRLPAESATALLREMDFALASAILRRIPQAQQQQVLSAFPERRRQEFQAVMRFAADTVGANMSTAFVTAAMDDTVADALRRVKEDQAGQSDAVFVIDESQKLLGSIRLAVLVRERSRKVLSDLLTDSCPPVAARTRVSQIAGLAAWKRHQQLPVISRRGELIGLIYRHVAKADAHGDAFSAATSQPSVVESLLSLMISGSPTLPDAAASSSVGPAKGETGNER